jgi:hypothetical protein
MFRKIHSNRDPRDTLYSELKKEFGSYFVIMGNAGKRLADAYPKLLFAGMVVLLAASLTLSFFVFRGSVQEKPPVAVKVNPIADGFNHISEVTDNIRETLRLKKLVDSISMKKDLTAEDSTALDSALVRLSQLRKYR